MWLSHHPIDSCHVLNRGTSKKSHENFILQASEIVQKAREIVGHFHHSAEANHNLTCISAGINESETHLIQDNDTRWDSTHDLIGSVVTKFKSLKIYSLQYPGKIKEFNMFEEEFLVHCYGILSPFKWVTKMLQGDYPTMSIYYPCIDLLLKSMHPQGRSHQNQSGQVYLANLTEWSGLSGQPDRVVPYWENSSAKSG